MVLLLILALLVIMVLVVTASVTAMDHQDAVIMINYWDGDDYQQPYKRAELKVENSDT